MLRRWWEKKYKIPSNHKLFEDRTIEDLLIEYHTDFFENNPTEVYRTEGGEYRLGKTGDPYFDKWETEIADGIAPDLTEMFSPEEMAKYHRLRKLGGNAARNLEAQEATDAHAANHPVERGIRARQEALSNRLAPDRFPGTFGDD